MFFFETRCINIVFSCKSTQASQHAYTPSVDKTSSVVINTNTSIKQTSVCMVTIVKCVLECVEPKIIGCQPKTLANVKAPPIINPADGCHINKLVLYHYNGTCLSVYSGGRNH